MKGTIIYLTSFCVRNKELKSLINSCHASYFYNTEICYPSKRSILYVDKDISYENEILNKEFNIIDSKIKLCPISEKIFENTINLINSITFKQSIINLDEIYRLNNDYFLDPNLFIKVYAVLTKLRLKESARRAIMVYFENSINSSDIALKSSYILKNLDKNILNSHNLY